VLAEIRAIFESKLRRGIGAAERESLCMSTTETNARPIRSLPSGDAGGAAADVMVNVVPMTYRVAAQWHSQVQPLIDANYVYAAEARAGQGIRAE
jgi:hypothetical protein